MTPASLRIRNLFGLIAPACRSLCLVFFALAAATILNSDASGQTLPKDIRGYKVYNTRLRVLVTTDVIEKAENTDAIIRLGTPQFADISLTGVGLNVAAEIKAIQRSGSIDFVTFRDFKVNGVPVEIEEYSAGFSFQSNQISKLPKPVRIHIGTSSTVRTAFRELIGSKKEWTVEGTVIVFGKFRKFGIDFKRAIPVKMSFIVTNPITSFLT